MPNVPGLDDLCATALTSRQVLSGDSRRLFRRFLRGYAASVPQPQRATGDGSVLAEMVSLPEEERGRPPRKLAKDSDHYGFFATVPSQRLCSPQDSEQRLRSRRMQLLRVRAAYLLRPRKGPKRSTPGLSDSPENHRDQTPSPPSSPAPQRKAVEPEKVSATSAAATLALKAEMKTREACESLRFLVFGTNANDKRIKEGGGGSLEQRCGTRDDVMQLHKIWDQIDEDGSGDVEFQEFLNFFSRSKADRLLGMRCVNYLIGKAKCEGNEDREGGCTVQDMMRLLWLKSTDVDLEKMMRWFCEAEYQRDRVPTPPLLPRRKRREILENFPRLKFGPSGRIGFRDLVESSLVDEVTMRSLWEFGEKRESISEEDLLEMLCPNGYRAHPNAKSAVDRNGQLLMHVTNEFFSGWLVAGRESKWVREVRGHSLHEAESAAQIVLQQPVQAEQVAGPAMDAWPEGM